MIEWKTDEDNWDDSANEGETFLPNASEHARAETSSQSASSGFPFAGEFIARHRGIAILLSLVIALVVAAGLALKWQASRNLAAVKVDVQGVVDQETWALESGNRELYASLLDPQAPASWHQQQRGDFERHARQGSFTAEVTELTLTQPDLALAEVRIDPPDRQPYREMRAYRQVGRTWRHTPAPHGQLWLHPVERETANLRFVFHRDDAERLIPLLPAMQDLYTQLLADFGLTPIPGKRELRIALSVRPADAGFAESSVGYDLTPLATTSDPGEIQRELGRQLADKVMAQFRDGVGDMAFVLDGIREWEVSSWMGEAGSESKSRLISRVLQDQPFIPLLRVEPAYFDAPALRVLTETIVDFLVQQHGRDVVKRLIDTIERLFGSGYHPGRLHCCNLRPAPPGRSRAGRQRAPEPVGVDPGGPGCGCRELRGRLASVSGTDVWGEPSMSGKRRYGLGPFWKGKSGKGKKGKRGRELDSAKLSAAGLWHPAGWGGRERGGGRLRHPG